MVNYNDHVGNCRVQTWISWVDLWYLSVTIRARLQNSINKNLPFCKIKVTFNSTARLSNFFRFKDKVSFNLPSNVVYKFSWGRCNATYYGETYRHLNIRVGEHSGVSLLTGKKSKAKTTTAIKDHMLFCDHVVSLEDVKILASINSEFHLKIKESILTSREKPELNRNEKSLHFIYLINVFLLKCKFIVNCTRKQLLVQTWYQDYFQCAVFNVDVYLLYFRLKTPFLGKFGLKN